MAQLYKFTPNQVREMTLEQQTMLLSSSADGTIKIEDYAEYEAMKGAGLI